MAKLRMHSRSFEKRRISFKNTKRKTVSQKVRESESLLVFLSAFFLCLISVSYVFQTNSIATRGYEVEEYQTKLEDLQSQNQNMKNQEAELRSIKNLEGEKGKLCTVTSGDIDYQISGDTAVALRQ